jgi:hypothetical protein
MMTTTLLHLPTGQLRPGDVVLEHGMRVRIDSVRPFHAHGSGCVSGYAPGEGPMGRACALAWSCPGTVLNVAEVRAAKVVPASFLYDEQRMREGPGHGREDSWNVQGNNLAWWSVERETS